MYFQYFLTVDWLKFKIGIIFQNSYFVQWFPDYFPEHTQVRLIGIHLQPLAPAGNVECDTV